MSNRASLKKEIAQWGYVLLIGIALFSTVLPRAVGNTKSGDLIPVTTERSLGACLASTTAGMSSEKQACEMSADTPPPDSMKALFESAYVNTKVGPSPGGSSE